MAPAVIVAAAALAAVSHPKLAGPGKACGGAPGPSVIPGEYILTLRRAEGARDEKAVDAAHAAVAARTGGRRLRVGAFRAVHAALNDTALLAELRGPDVAAAEPNQVVRAAGPLPCADRQGEPLSWGQKRVTAAAAGDVAAVYAHDKGWGAGVDAYVIDTGVRITHEEFGGRAEWGTNTAGGSDTDMNGHGTHCAGTVAGATYGVAKAARVIAVKVLGDDGSGSTAGVIAGVEWAAQQARANRRKRPSVGNMSLGGGYSAALNGAVNAAVAEGLNMAVAAGNCARDACSYSPASAEDAVCVGSTELASLGGEQTDAMSAFSNHGPCTDVFAPGSSIDAAYSTSDSAYATLSGTSMASPHVAGVIAAYLSAHPAASPKEVTEWVTRSAVAGVIRNLPQGSADLMLHIPCSTGPTPPPTPAPPTPAPTPEPPLSPQEQDKEWVLSVAGGNCNDACAAVGKACVETEWPRSEAEFRDVVAAYFSKKVTCNLVLPGGYAAAPETAQGQCYWQGAASRNCASSDGPFSSFSRFCPCN